MLHTLSEWNMITCISKWGNVWFPQNLCKVLQNLSKAPQNLSKVPQKLSKVPQNLSMVPQNLHKVPQNLCKESKKEISLERPMKDG